SSHGDEIGTSRSLPCLPCVLGHQRVSGSYADDRVSDDRLSALIHDEDNADCCDDQVPDHRRLGHSCCLLLSTSVYRVGGFSAPPRPSPAWELPRPGSLDPSPRLSTG